MKSKIGALLAGIYLIIIIYLAIEDSKCYGFQCMFSISFLFTFPVSFIFGFFIDTNVKVPWVAVIGGAIANSFILYSIGSAITRKLEKRQEKISMLTELEQGARIQKRNKIITYILITLLLLAFLFYTGIVTITW